MPLAAVVAQDVTAAAFVALGLAITFQWYRERRRALAMLAGALDSIALVALVGRLSPLLPAWLGPPINVLLLAAFMTSGYFLLLFRDAFIPLSERARLAARILFGVSVVDGILLVTGLQNGPRPIVSLILFEYVAAWAIFIGEPIIRFWLASISLPPVQKVRMRFLSGGFAVLILVVVVSSAGGAAFQSPLAVLITQLVSLATVPLIYFSFSPPALLRRLWRMSEESALRGSMQDLLIFSPSRHALAERAIFWAVRLVGATAGFVVDSDGKIMAVIGMDKSEAATLSSHSESRAQLSAGQVISTPLLLSEGPGKLAVVAGPFSPVFGSEEIAQLNAYANSVTAGLERARVTERMTAIEKNKTQFLNLASHELRGPVTVIRGYVSMLEDGMLGKLNERGRKAAAVMAAKISEMNELIEGMIDAARLEDGGLTLRPVELDLRDVVREASDVVAPMVDGEHRIELDLPDRRVRVKADPDRTRTIVTNLLSNAIKYSPSGGQIVCSVRARGGTARVAVTDEGLGIARESMSILFTRFGRVVTPETEHLKGTGLGLFLSRQLARLQGGDITVVSEPRKGSTFTLHLPVAPRTDAQMHEPDESAAPEPEISARQN